MKILSQLLALVTFQLHVLGTNGFVPIKANVRPSVTLHSSPGPDVEMGAIMPGSELPPEDWDMEPNIILQGSTLRTWTFYSPSTTSEQIVLSTDGRPLHADVDLWIGPDWTPFTMKIYSEDGDVRPVRTMIGTKGVTNTIAIRNTAAMEFPIAAACAEANGSPGRSPGLAALKEMFADMSYPSLVQGGAVFTTPFPPDVERVQVLLKTDGMKLNARVELLQGPNNIKQQFEFHTNSGADRPFYALMESPGTGNVVRIVNLATVEFPLYAHVVEG